MSTLYYQEQEPCGEANDKARHNRPSNLLHYIVTIRLYRNALFGFCIALVLFNILSTVKAALRSAAGGEKKLERNLSSYYLAGEISGAWCGMQIAVPAECWTDTFAALTPTQLAAKLLWLAKKVDLRMFYTNPWTPKKPKPEKISGNRGNHVATQQILDQRKKPLTC